MGGNAGSSGRWRIGLLLDARARNALVEERPCDNRRAFFGKGGIMRRAAIGAARHDDLGRTERARGVGNLVNHLPRLGRQFGPVALKKHRKITR